MPGNLRNFVRGLSLCAIAATMGYFDLDNFGRDQRLAANPHVGARVERTWVEVGKGGGRYATLTFPGAENGAATLCRVDRVYLGPVTLAATDGESLDVAPRPNSCGRPDIPGVGLSQRASLAVLAISALFALVGLSFAARAL